jgi:ankyrin repeat protein
MFKASLHDQLYVLALVYTNDIEKLEYLIDNNIIDIDFNFTYKLPITNDQNVIDIINELLLINGFFDDLSDFMKKNRLFRILFRIYEIDKLKPNKIICDLFETDFDEQHQQEDDFNNYNHDDDDDDDLSDFNFETEEFFEMTLLKVAVIMEYEDMVKCLLGNGTTLNLEPTDLSDIHPIHLTLYQNNSVILKILLDKLNEKKQVKNKSINKLLDKNGFNPLHLAIFNQNIEAINLLYDFGADINQRLDSVSYPLIWSMETFDVTYELIEHLLSLGADPNLVDQTQGVSPLNVAILTNKIDLVKLLIQYGANVNQSFDDQSNSSLKLAIELASQHNNDTSIIEVLLESGADVNLNFNYNTTLNEQNILIQPNRNYSTTPLITAISLNNEKIVELLLKYRAYPHTTPYDMYSPLSSACFLNNKKIVDLLLSYNIDPTLSSYQSNHPLTVCLSKVTIYSYIYIYINNNKFLFFF